MGTIFVATIYEQYTSNTWENHWIKFDIFQKKKKQQLERLFLKLQVYSKWLIATMTQIHSLSSMNARSKNVIMCLTLDEKTRECNRLSTLSRQIFRGDVIASMKFFFCFFVFASFKHFNIYLLCHMYTKFSEKIEAMFIQF